MKKYYFREDVVMRFFYFFLYAVMLTGLFAGFGCATGTDETPQEPGAKIEYCDLCHQPGGISDVKEVHLRGARTLVGSITNVTVIDSTTTISFHVEDPSGTDKTGLPNNDIRFTVAQLVLASGGDSSYWLSLINKTETKEAGDPGTTPDGTTATQAAYEKADTAGGIFADLGGGDYTYVLNADITLATGYDTNATIRVAMQISGNITNGVYDFVPSGAGSVSTRDIVTNAGSCNACHEKLGFHGIDRVEIDYCVTCHNKGTVDANSGNNLDMVIIVHKIHMGKDLPSYKTEGAYTIWGYNNSENNYAGTYPGYITTCTRCHAAGPSEADNWKDVPTIAACGSCHDDKEVPIMASCGSCHDDFDFVAGANHEAGAQPGNNNCAACHSAEIIATGHHGKDPTRIEAEDNVYEIISVTNTAPGESPVITFKVTDAAGTKDRDITSDFADGGEGVDILIGLGTQDDYNGNPGANGAPIEIRDAFTIAVDNMDGTYTLTSPTAIPFNASGSGVVAFQGHPYKDVDSDGTDDKLPVKNVVKYFAITDASVKERREVVDIDSCNLCHESLSMHGQSRTDSIETCVICHNPNATDVPYRTSGNEVPVDFKNMIHAIHAGEMREINPLTIIGYGGSSNDYSEVLFPGRLNNCESCHIKDADTYMLPLGNAAGSTMTSTVNRSYITPLTSACTSCHDNQEAFEHVILGGGAFDATD